MFSEESHVFDGFNQSGSGNSSLTKENLDKAAQVIKDLSQGEYELPSLIISCRELEKLTSEQLRILHQACKVITCHIPDCLDIMIQIKEQ